MIDTVIQRAQDGDRVALESVLKEIAPAVRRFGLRLCGNRHDADDALQDTLLTIATHLPEYQGNAAFTSWVFALTRSACTRRRRGSKNAPPVSDEHLAEEHAPGPDPEQSAATDQELRTLDRALASLSDEHREVIALRDIEGLDANEAASALEIGVPAMKSRLHRAREALRLAVERVRGERSVARDAECPDIAALWSQKYEGDLAAADCAQIEAHVTRCAHCSAICDELRSALGACKRLASGTVEPDVQLAVRRAMERLVTPRG